MAGPLDAGALELAKLFDHHNLPAKLRCASCNGLAIDAVKLPCCEQAICEPCMKGLTETCPVCEHTPVVAEECKPHKNLRMTVRAFLKSEEKKRGKDIPVVPSIEATAPPTFATPTPATADAPVDIKEESVHVGSSASKSGENTQDEASIDQHAEGQPSLSNNEPPAEDDDEDEEDEDDIVVTTEKDQNSTAHEEEDHAFDENHIGVANDQSQINGHQDFGSDQSQQGFGNMNFNNMNGFNPMMAMQNSMGMPGFGMGMPNMMGMPGMNMDPSMMFNGGFGGMGMNDMSMMGMGMAMGNFGGMPGMGGMGEPGFFHEQSGYNSHQNFGNNMHQTFRNDRGFGRPYGRGYGRGRGFNGYNRGRGGFGFQQQQNFGHNQGHMQNVPQQYQNQQGYGNHSAEASTEPTAERGSPSYEPMNPKDGSAKDAGLVSRQVTGEPNTTEDTNGAENSATNEAGSNGTRAHGENGAPNEAKEGDETISGELEFPYRQQPSTVGTETLHEGSSAAPAGGSDRGGQAGAIQSYAGDDTSMQQSDYPLGPSGMGGQESQSYNGQYQQFSYGQRGGGGGFRGRGGFGGRGGYGYGAFTEAKELTSTPAPPINAPTGPKAMREGKPNTGFNPKLAQMQVQAQAQPAPVAPSHSEDARARRSDRDERDRSYSRSRSRSKHRSSRRHYRSESEDSESEESRQRRKDRERRKRKDRDRRAVEEHAETDDAGRKGRSKDESGVEDSSTSRRRRDRDDEHRSSRSHRDRSRERDRHRHRHRSRSPAKDGSVNGDTDSKTRRKSRRDRKYDDDDDRETDKRDGRRQSHRADEDRGSHREKTRTVLEQPSDDIGFKIKGSKSAAINPAGMGPPRRSSPQRRRQSDAASSKAAAADPYAAEREKRHAERVLKEQQRRQGSSLGKRVGRDDEEEEFDAPRGPKGDGGVAAGSRKRKERKVSVRYEGEVNEESQDRDSGRWR